ncbi:hypothetical protein ACFY1P_33945 [Streptomyces sp. NPDC001407]|uniref:hypothetical protein n=1 Tax=Streptomyces sp. NPDC001407 TaxID=3364573 RepID=UPI0036889AB1
MTLETLPELIHRLVEAKGREWIERELGYTPDVIDHHLTAYTRSRRTQLTGPPTPPDAPDVENPLRMVDLARHLRARFDTLSRALRNDPAAPRPVPGRTPAVWRYAEVYAWWPNRRRRGQRGPAHHRNALAANGEAP